MLREIFAFIIEIISMHEIWLVRDCSEAILKNNANNEVEFNYREANTRNNKNKINVDETLTFRIICCFCIIIEMN